MPAPNKAMTLKEQFGYLQQLTCTMGSIHEAQILQLKVWSRIIENVTKSKISIDPERKLIEYSCDSTGLRPHWGLVLQCHNVSEWTKAILWPESVITIVINGKPVYDSRNPPDLEKAPAKYKDVKNVRPKASTGTNGTVNANSRRPGKAKKISS